MDFSNESRNLQIGEYLQTLRMEQNLTLEHLSHASQVPIVHLTSIEEGRFLKFDDFYLKMYLKRYTQALNVDLEQLYAYATQQMLPEKPAKPEKNKRENERKLTQTQANISAVVKRVDNNKPTRNKTTIKPANIARLDAKNKIGKFIIGTIFIILLIVIVIYFIRFIINLPDERPLYNETEPPLVDNPHDIVIPGEENEDDENNDEPIETEPEEDPEPVPTDLTTVEFEERVGNTQTFIIATSLDELELRIEHTGDNWIDLTNGTYNDTFEYTFDVDELIDEENGRVRFIMGAFQNVEAIYLNDVEVDFEAAGIIGRQDFVFYVEAK